MTVLNACHWKQTIPLIHPHLNKREREKNHCFQINLSIHRIENNVIHTIMFYIGGNFAITEHLQHDLTAILIYLLLFFLIWPELWSGRFNAACTLHNLPSSWWDIIFQIFFATLEFSYSFEGHSEIPLGIISHFFDRSIECYVYFRNKKWLSCFSSFFLFHLIFFHYLLRNVSSVNDQKGI